MKTTMCWGALLLVSLNLQAACQEMVRSSWRLLPQEKKIEWLKDFKSEKICSDLPESKSANAELKLVLGNQIFKRNIHIALNQYWDSIENKKLIGGARPSKEIFFESHMPDWAKRAKMTVTELESGKILGQGSAK
ncbi:MAG: hypothetical protein K2P81_07275 [Bacteriovoracaceae bacterium]|nr:hypothetical protein [Bacteriovoracaceae bacterium]